MASLRILALLALASASCSGSPKPGAQSGAEKKASGDASTTRIVAFAVSNENLNVDAVGMRDGAIRADGSRDHVFTATVEGAFDAIFLVETNQKGEPIHGYRADTMVSLQDLPRELGGVVDTGKMTLGIGVVENGKFINAENGSVSVGPGIHNLKLYAPNTNLLTGGDFVRLFARTENGEIVSGPIAPY